MARKSKSIDSTRGSIPIKYETFSYNKNCTEPKYVSNSLDLLHWPTLNQTRTVNTSVLFDCGCDDVVVLCLLILITLLLKSLCPDPSNAAVFFRTSGFWALYSIIWLLLCAGDKPSFNL